MQTCTVKCLDARDNKIVQSPSNGIVVRIEGEFLVVSNYGQLSGVLVEELWSKALDVYSIHVQDMPA